MEVKTEGIIRTIKECTVDSDVAIRNYMEEYSGSNWSYFSRNDIDAVLRQVVCDYLECCDDGRKEACRLVRELGVRNNVYSAMIGFLMQIRMRDSHGNLTNGFDKVEDKYGVRED